MADDYLGRKMEEYRARQAAGPRPQRPAATLRRLLLRNRSYRGYDPHFLVRRDQLLSRRPSGLRKTKFLFYSLDIRNFLH